MTQLTGKTAIVTGAAQGIGRAIARRLAAAGATVITADINAPSEDDGRFWRTDVRDEDSVRALITHACDTDGGVDVLVNNAGIALEKRLDDTTVTEWENIMAVNTRGVFLCCKHVRAAMQRRGGGSIVNIGSIEGLGANHLHSAYAASKAAVHALTRNTAVEYGDDGIRCNAIAPGWIETPLNENLIAQYPNPDDARQAIRRLHPVGRLGAPDDIAALALWLASDDAGFASGQIYTLDGGRMARLPLPSL